MRAATLGLLGLAAASCRPSAETTPQIHVVPRAAALWGKLLASPSSAPMAAGKPVRVHAMKDGEALGGPNAVGRPGDILLENDEVSFVIDQIGSSAGFAESGGNLVDAADAHERKDELGQMFTYFGVFPRQGVYTTLATGTSANGAAWVEVTGHELYESALGVRTRYTLAPANRWLFLETEITNTGQSPLTIPSLGDAIQWGGTEKFAPGKSVGFKGPSAGAFVGAVGRFASYAVTSTDGEIQAVSGTTWTDTAVRNETNLAAGQRAKYGRVFVVGQRADGASLLAELAKAAGKELGALSIALASTDGAAAIDVPPDAQLTARSESDSDVITIHASGMPSSLTAELPVGKWSLAYRSGGGRAGSEPVSVEVRAKTDTNARLKITEGARVRALCVAADGSGTPCKVTFERTDGSPPPDFGPSYASGPARNQATTADGRVDVAVAPGRYEVTASRGPEYTLDQRTITLAPGDHPELRLTPRRVVDTSGYLGCDFHQHTMLGADAPVGTRDRVIANAAEGVEVAVATEHNVVANLEPIVQAMHLERDLVSISGDEVTTDASRHPWGHANAWPMAFDAQKSRGGAPPVRDVSPRDLIDELRHTQPADFVFQINHPRSGANGYFDLLRFDRESGQGKDPAYDARFDAVEVWNGRNIDARASVLEDFLALLRTGHPVTPTANTDTHGIVGQEAGYPRTYVRVPDDAHIDGWSAERTLDLVRGVKTLRDVVLTNGPMLRVDANGVPVGGLAHGRQVRLRVRVQSAPWVVVNRLQLLRASVRDPGAQSPPVPVSERRLPSGAIGAEHVFTVQADVDDAFVVVASGERPLTPVLGPGHAKDADEAAIAPWAMTGPLWVDVDSDGDSLGKKAP